jgi:hypothetical protein
MPRRDDEAGLFLTTFMGKDSGIDAIIENKCLSLHSES